MRYTTVKTRPSRGRQAASPVRFVRGTGEAPVLRWKNLVLHPIQRCAPVKSRAKGCEADEHAGLDAAVAHAFVEKDRQRAGGRVAVALDVVRHFLRR